MVDWWKDWNGIVVVLDEESDGEGDYAETKDDLEYLDIGRYEATAETTEVGLKTCHVNCYMAVWPWRQKDEELRGDRGG